MRRSLILTMIAMFGLVAGSMAQKEKGKNKGKDKNKNQYIITTARDTIQGELKINPVGDNSRQMSFRPVDEKRMIIYPHKTWLAYYTEEQQFRPVVHNNARLFMTIVTEGRVSLYNYIRKNSSGNITSSMVITDGQQSKEISSFTFKKTLGAFLKDCPALTPRVEGKDFKYKDIKSLVEEYNQCDLSTPAPAPAPAPVAVVATTAPASSGALPEHIQEALDELENLRAMVNENESIEDRQDLLELTEDLSTRMKEEEKIPNYVWDSLESMTKADPKLTEKSVAVKEKYLQSN